LSYWSEVILFLLSRSVLFENVARNESITVAADDDEDDMLVDIIFIKKSGVL
jgi:hypothetical protein